MKFLGEAFDNPVFQLVVYGIVDSLVILLFWLRILVWGYDAVVMKAKSVLHIEVVHKQLLHEFHKNCFIVGQGELHKAFEASLA